MELDSFRVMVTVLGDEIMKRLESDQRKALKNLINAGCDEDLLDDLIFVQPTGTISVLNGYDDPKDPTAKTCAKNLCLTYSVLMR